MIAQDTLFVFHGQSGSRAARLFEVMARTQAERDGGRLARIVLLTPARAEGSAVVPVDLGLPATGDVHEHPEDQKIELVVPEDFNLHVITLGEYRGVPALISDEAFEILTAKLQPPSISAFNEEIPVTEEAGRQLPFPEVGFRFTHIPLLPSRAAPVRKPNKEVLIESGLPHAPGKYKWTANEYIQQELLQKVSRLAESTRRLHARLSDYDNWMDLLEFFTLKPVVGNIEGEVTQSFNKLVCSNAICQTALQLDKMKDLSFPVSIALSERSLRHAAVFVPLTYKAGIRVETQLAKGSMAAYRIVFAQPVPDLLNLVKLVRMDMEMMHSTIYFHELNREMLESEIFGAEVPLPFYDADSLRQELERAADRNHLQAMLETKEVFYALHQGEQLKRCIALCSTP